MKIIESSLGFQLFIGMHELIASRQLLSREVIADINAMMYNVQANKTKTVKKMSSCMVA
jgi:hypothetical protein